MAKETISGDMRVWNVIQHHPETVDVFLRHGCPDMRKGIYAFSAHIMNVNWAAKIHHIEADKLLDELNQTVRTTEEQEKEEPTLH